MNNYILIIKRSLVLGVFITLASTVFSQRNVFWLEGLNQNGNNMWRVGSSPNWTDYETLFDQANGGQFNMRSFSGNYADNTGIPDATLSADNNIFTASGVNFNLTAANNIAIGHSTGGVVLRELDVNPIGGNRRFGGVITIGAPLDGAFVGQSADNGQVQAAANNVATQLLLPFATANAANLGIVVNNTSPFFGFVTPGIAGTLTVGVLVAGVFQLGNGLLEDDLLNLDPTERDLAGLPVNGVTYLDGIQNANTNTPVINIWGKELSPVSYRLWTSFASEEEDDVAPGGLANIATNGITARNTAVGIYSLGAVTSLTVALIGRPILGVVNAATWGNAAHLVGVRAEEIYRDLIGANRLEQRLVCTTIWRCNDDMWDACINGFGSGINFCNDWCTRDVCYSVFTNISEDSDGYIHEGSQKGRNSAWRGQAIRVDEMNHGEEWYHDDLGVTLRRIFDGTHPDIINKPTYNFFQL